jgi:hypothetical protein
MRIEENVHIVVHQGQEAELGNFPGRPGDRRYYEQDEEYPKAG